MKRIGIIAAALWFGSRAWCAAQTAVTADQLGDLQKQVDTLKHEVDNLKTSGETPAPKEANGKEAAEPKLEWGGFGEMAYQNFGNRLENGNPSGLRDQANLTRLTVDGVYHFNDWIKMKFEFESLNAGVNAQNGNSNSKGAAFDVEQAYMDFKLSDPFGIRAGLVVLPMGLVNEKHRPTDFVGVLRPSVESLILPSTWREMGAGFFGSEGIVSYRSYVVTGLDPVANGTNQVNGFTGSQGIKGGRSLGALSFANDGASVSRVDITPVKNVFAGGSYYIGEAGQGQTGSNVPITIWDVHAYADCKDARLQAVWAQGNLANAGAIDRAQLANNAKFTDFAGNKFWGGYVSLDYNALHALGYEHLKYAQYFGPYFRYERYDTADNMPFGFNAAGSNTRREWTTGLNFKPIRQVIVKAEYQWLNNEGHTGVHEWNLGLGYEF